MTPEVYTVTEAAELLRVSPRTIRRWANDGRIPSVHIGRILRIPRGAFDAVLEAEKSTPAA